MGFEVREMGLGSGAVTGSSLCIYHTKLSKSQSQSLSLGFFTCIMGIIRTPPFQGWL